VLEGGGGLLASDGALLAVPPSLLFMRDTNGDGKGDSTTEVANDYGPADNPEQSANGVVWALVKWFYCAKHSVGFGVEPDGEFSRVDPVARGTLGNLGEYGWSGAASTHYIADPEKDIVALFLTQKPDDRIYYRDFTKMVYQAFLE
jgi:CubicO group peptidase (beta-lactamase class C family)